MSIASFFTEDQKKETLLETAGQISISEFLNTAYRDFALYVLHSRAIPSMIDGFKPGQRKVVWVAGQLARTKKIKTAALSGATVLYAGFHHGDGSLSAAATLMAGPWCNNVPVLEGEGNFGSRIANEASAPRYTHVKLSPEFDRYFIDNDVLESSPDPEDKEPKFLLPLIPWVLVNGVSGIAIGYGTKIMPRDPKLLASVCADLISGKKTEADVLAMDLPPHFEGFSGKVYKDLKGKWRCQGVFSRQGRSTIKITDLPIGVERESYVTTLQALIEKEKISDYSDDTAKSFDFSVKVPGAPQKSDEEIIKLLSLDHGIGETIRVIDETGSLRTFSSANELLVAFCKYRISIYPRRLKAWQKRDQDKLDLLLSKVKFVKEVLDLDLILSEFRESKAALKAELVRRSYPQAHLEDLMDMKIWYFSDSWISEVQKDIISLQKAVDTWKTAIPEKMFEKELRSL